MKEHEIVFIVLCYKNTIDVVDLLENLKGIKRNYGVILVNSYYDEKSFNEIESISKRYNCYFVPVENKGYGAGNNAGIEYALKNLQFDIACICNPDILFEDPSKLNSIICQKSILAPEIIARNGKHQNPYYPIFSRVVYGLKKAACLHENKVLFYCAVAINKINTAFFRKIHHNIIEQVYACHGSCFFIGLEAIEVLKPLYNENMFLFNEEEHLAKKAAIADVPIIYDKRIRVFHKEDGSSDEIIKNNKEFEFLCKSFNKMTEYWEGK